MGSGGSNVATLPPPPVPKPQTDDAAMAAEAALMGQAKQTYASTVGGTDKMKANLGATTNTQGQTSTAQQSTPGGTTSAATAMNASPSLGTSAVLTG